MKKVILVFVCLIFCANVGLVKTRGEVMVIEQGREVSFDYTLTIGGQVIDSSKETEPLSYIHGEGKIIPGLSSQLEGLKVGDEKTIEVAPEDAYGHREKEATREIPKDSLPQGLKPKPDMMLQLQTPQGRSAPVRISEVKDDVVVVDLNHPLAGETLIFDVEIKSVK